MSLKELLSGISAEKAGQLVDLLKQRESLAGKLARIDEQIDGLVPAGKIGAGGKRRKPSIEIPDLLSKHPEGMTIKEIQSSLSLNYPQTYITLVKLKKANKVSQDKESKKYSLKASSKAKNQPF